MVDKLVNPYIAGAPVTEEKMFFGRDDVFDWIQNSLMGKYTDHILVIHGQRRVGKTSVLKQLGNRLPPKYIPVFFDLQGRTHTTLDRFLWWLAREMVRVLRQERGIDIPAPDRDAFSTDLEYFETRFLSTVLPMLDNVSLLLTFDEFDNLEESEIRETLARPLIDYLRRMMGMPGLNFIFSIGSSGRKLENMQAAYTDFFKTALYKKISFLNEEQTYKLITRPVEGILEYDEPATNRIYKIVGGHPYFTQLTCHELFARCQRTDQRIIKEDDVDAILDDVVERGTVNLKFVWDEASDMEKWGLSALAQIEGKTDSHAIANYLRKQHVRFSESDLTSGLLHLREKDVLTDKNQFVIHLLRLWLQKNRPIERVREELTEVNPIANRYIEIGLEFKDKGIYDKAIESFQAALEVAKDNVQAQVSIALVYLEQKAYDKSIIEFEKALTMDDEDISTRAGLCDAHLALGNMAMQKGLLTEAEGSYQRVLAINDEHTEARQRMAEISRQRAENELLNGRDEEALSAFTEALRFTPEDPTLIARVEQFRAEKKTKILTTLLANSEKDALVKNWDGAVRSLEEALVVSPNDEAIQKKLADVRAAQAKEQVLSAIYADAQKAYAGKDYDQAVSLFKKIILEDENYRDASRLMAQAIELRRTAPKWWQRKAPQAAKRTPLSRSRPRVSPKKILMIGAASILVFGIIGGLFWFAKNGMFAAPSPTSTTTRAAPTVTATPTLDPAIQSALDTIESVSPVYQTSFDSWEFGEPVENASIDSGKLILVGANQSGSNLVINDFASDYFAVEFELGNLESNPEGSCNFNTGNEQDTGSESWKGLSAQFSQKSALLARLEYPEYKDFVWEDYESSSANTVLLLILKDQITTFVNGELIYTVLNPDGSNVYFQYTLSAYGTDESYVCEFDNYKFWDLSGIPTLSPKIQAGLNFIETQPPDYQTSFDSWDFGELPSYASVDTGKLVLTSTGEHVGVGLDIFDSDHLAVEFEFAIVDSEQDGHCVFYAEGYGDQETPRGVTSGFHNSGGLNFALAVQEIQHDYAYSSFDASKPNKYTLMILGDELVGFINGQLVYAERDPNGKALYTASSFAASHGITCEYDNFKAWDLRKGITVTSAEDSGPGTMRQALLDAQVGDVIKFDADVFPPDQPATIYLSSELPRISQGNITIDASNAGVILDGTNLQEGDFGLIISSDGNTIMGLQIINVAGMAIYVEGGGYNVIGGNRTIGAGPIGQGNLIASNGMGIDLVFEGAGGNIIKGNIIGADASGNGAIGNADAGINFEGLSPGGIPYGFTHNIVGPDNIIIKNGAGGGIRIESVRVPVIITANAIYDNEGPGINHNISTAEPDESVIFYFELASGIVNGSTCKDCVVEVFSTDTKDGKVYEGTVTADAFGNFSFNKGEALSGPFLTATTTPPGGSTSEFSQPTSTLSTIQIVLDVIQSKAPLYQTSFDSWDFGNPVDNARLENGKLIVNGGTDSSTFVNLYNLSSDRFAVEFELRTLETGSGSTCILGIENGGNNEEALRVLNVGFDANGRAILTHYVHQQGLPVLVEGEYEDLKTNTVTLIIIGNQIATLVNGKIVYMALDPAGNAVYTNQHVEANMKTVCEYDNYKFWDLSGANLNP